MKKLSFPLCLVVASVGLAATPRHVAKPVVSVETMKTVDREISSDAYEGRAPTTPAETKTIGYISHQFAAAGLKPGNHGSWFQKVPFVAIAGTPTPLTVTGGKTPLVFQNHTDMVANTFRIQPEVAVNDSDVVFVGYGINAPEKGWNDYAGVDVRGKTVIILINDPDWQTTGLDGPFGGRAMTYYGRWTYKYEEAARQGAAAAFIIHDTEPAAYGWNVVDSSWGRTQYELDDPANHMDQSRADGWITNDAAHRLFASAGMDLDALTAAAGHKGFHAVPMGLKASIGIANQIRRQASNNVIGILPGRTRPNEYVLYTAHWDHLGHCKPLNGDDICNGAIDNGTGIAALVALARAHAAAGAAQRSIVFLAVTGEESGLLGSKYYAEHPVYPLSRTAGGVNMDALPMAGATRDVVIIGAGKSQLDGYVRRAAAAQGRTISPDPDPEKGHYYRSDHFSFAREGVPMADFGAGVDLVNGGTAAGTAARADYVAHRYHQPSDEYDPGWDWSGVAQDVALFYQVGRQLAGSGDWPQWSPGAEFHRKANTRPAR